MKKEKRRLVFEGLPVIDADADVVLTVTGADVRNSFKKDPNRCAAAQAGRRELRKDVKVFLSRMYVKEKDHWVRYLTPDNAAREIVSFDRGSEFMPGEYKFKAASPGQRLGRYHHGRGKTSGSKARRSVTQNVRISAQYGSSASKRSKRG